MIEKTFTYMRRVHGKHGRVGARTFALAPGYVVRLESDLAGVHHPGHAAKIRTSRVPVVAVERTNGGRSALQL